MGAWRRHRRRHAGGDAGGRTQCQSRRTRSYSDRGRASDRRMDASDVRFPEPGERDFRHRHVDGESDGGAGCANIGAWTVGPQARYRRRRRITDRLYIESADSIALDFHKWGQVPYDAGFLLVRDGDRHRDTFAAPAAYLRRETRGLAAGSAWPCDLGPDLSRGFRALKTWFTLKTYGTEKLGAIIARTCALAGHLEMRVLAEPRLELLAPVQLNIVCFRYRAANANKVNGDIVIDIQESGIAAPSTTLLDGQLAIRAAIVNHRTDTCDIDALIAAVLEFGAQRSSSDGGVVLNVERSPPLAM